MHWKTSQLLLDGASPETIRRAPTSSPIRNFGGISPARPVGDGRSSCLCAPFAGRSGRNDRSLCRSSSASGSHRL